MDRRAFLDLGRRVLAGAVGCVSLPAFASRAEPTRRRTLFDDLGLGIPERQFGAGARLVNIDADAFGDEFTFAIGGKNYWSPPADREEGRTTEAFRFRASGSPFTSTLTRKGRMVAGVIETPEGRYSVRPLSGSAHLLVRSDGAPFDCQIAGAGEAVSRTGGKRRAVRSGATPEMVEVSYGLFYHSRFAAYMGGEENAKLVCQSIADGQNTVLAAGHNYMRVKLARAQNIEIGYGSPGRPDYATPAIDSSAAVNRLADDKYIQRLRREEQISIVGYFDRSREIGNGAAFMFRGFTWSGVGVWAGEWGTAGEGIAYHELGHTIGLDHDRSIAIGGGHPFAYGFLDCEHQMNCLMSNGPCFVRTQPLYSDPYIQVNGVPFGSREPGKESDASQVIRDYRFLIRDFWKAMPDD